MVLAHIEIGKMMIINVRAVFEELHEICIVFVLQRNETRIMEKQCTLSIVHVVPEALQPLAFQVRKFSCVFKN
eukprot:5940123-Ditylum_brightwellii.AAC.1